MKTINYNISFLIKSLKEKYQINNTEIAKRMGVSQACITGWESGYRVPSSSMQEKMCKVFDLNPEQLFEREIITYSSCKSIKIYDFKKIKKNVNFGTLHPELEVSIPRCMISDKGFYFGAMPGIRYLRWAGISANSILIFRKYEISDENLINKIVLVSVGRSLCIGQILVLGQDLIFDSSDIKKIDNLDNFKNKIIGILATSINNH